MASDGLRKFQNFAGDFEADDPGRFGAGIISGVWSCEPGDGWHARLSLEPAVDHGLRHQSHQGTALSQSANLRQMAGRVWSIIFSPLALSTIGKAVAIRSAWGAI